MCMSLYKAITNVRFRRQLMDKHARIFTIKHKNPAAIARINHIIMLADEIFLFFYQIEREAAWRVEGGAASASWPETGSVSFTNYDTRYRPGLDMVLKGITCSIKPAEKVRDNK